MNDMKFSGISLKEVRIDSTLSYDGNFLKVRKDNARMPDGSVSSREYITHPGAVAILALLDNGKILMERQFRYVPQQEFMAKARKGERLTCVPR